MADKVEVAIIVPPVRSAQEIQAERQAAINQNTLNEPKDSSGTVTADTYRTALDKTQKATKGYNPS